MVTFWQPVQYTTMRSDNLAVVDVHSFLAGSGAVADYPGI